MARTRLLLLAVDLAAVVLLHLFAFGAVAPARSWWPGPTASTALSIVALPVLLLMNGAYGLASVQSAVRMFRSLCFALPEYLAVVLLAHLLFPHYLGLTPVMATGVALGAAIGAAVSRALLFSLLLTTRTRPNVVIVGAGWSGRTIGEILANWPDGHFHLVGFIDDDPEKLHQEVVGGCRVIGTTHDLVPLVIEYQVSELVLAITEQVPERLFSTLCACAEQGVRVVSMATLYEEVTGRVPVKHIDDRWFLYCFAPERQRFYEAVKRGVDLLVSAVGLLAFAVILPFIALAILIDSGRPVFYRQVRVGRGERRFTICKFRTMVQDAEANGAVWATENDSRITRVGAFLRATRLDELPQLWNVLKGEMSLIGPRPERPEFVAELSRAIPFYNHRHAVLPGITGWAQVKYPYGASVEDALQKLQYDLYYIKHRSLFLDAVIVLETLTTMVARKGR
ncbi:MAG: TIGR03013 family PEP-CTERM/XrtA system glycosyltransferase [Armatimonadetes bacterium]|nr:TIGR03013 family PEP-CTERM/XrtA system glycosyltransferase [Armatimonadota bacterium]